MHLGAYIPCVPIPISWGGYKQAYDPARPRDLDRLVFDEKYSRSSVDGRIDSFLYSYSCVKGQDTVEIPACASASSQDSTPPRKSGEEKPYAGPGHALVGDLPGFCFSGNCL